jgi:hypothetical protein
VDKTDKPHAVVRIFESYGWKDANEIAQRLKDSLEHAGYRVWIDREHLRADDKHFSVALEDAIANAEVVIALLSPHSVRGIGFADERTSICYNEIRFAEELATPIVPVKVRRFTGAAPLLIIKYRILDWLDWEDPERYRRGLAEIMAAIDAAQAHELVLDRDISLQTSNFASQLRSARDDFTGREWLFERIARWLEGPRRCLRIEGITGSGKTAIVAELVRRNPDGHLLAYHFCTPTQLGAGGFVRSLAGMLAASVEGYAELLNSGRLGQFLSSADPSRMLAEGVLEPLRTVTMDGRYFIAIDALDEAVTSTGGQVSIPVLLSEYVDGFPPWLKLMITCRPQPRIQGLFGTAEVCSLDDAGAAQRSDLSLFLARRLADPALQRTVGPAQVDAARGLIAERACGNFQYAANVLDALASGELEPADLTGLPHSLEVFYYRRAVQRFPDFASYRAPRTVLETLASARAGLTAAQLGAITGLRDDELSPTLDTIGCFAGADAQAWRIAHQSVTDWLVSDDAREFRIDMLAARQRILAYCEGWAAHRDPYALTHVIAHLLDAGRVDDAVAAVIRDNLFGVRRSVVGEPRLDAEDTRLLTTALIAARNRAGIVGLACTANTWRRDGVASALQAAPPDAAEFVDGVVGALLAVSA